LRHPRSACIAWQGNGPEEADQRAEVGSSRMS
jgi:hypothetical protein